MGGVAFEPNDRVTWLTPIWRFRRWGWFVRYLPGGAVAVRETDGHVRSVRAEDVERWRD